MKKKLLKTVFSLLVAVFSLYLLRAPASAAANICDGLTLSTVNGLPACTQGGKLHLCKSNFPDSNFRYFLAQKLNISSQVLLSDQAFLTTEQLDTVQSIYCVSQRISSLQGIGFFANLTELNCNNNMISSLDLSHNTKLTDINCGSNSLISLTILAPQLENLACNYNKLSNLDNVYAPNLKKLDCSNNEISYIGFVFPNLTTLTCKNLPLSKIDLRNFPSLTGLNCSYCNLTSLDLTYAPSLIWLDCQNNNINMLDLSPCRALTSLTCSYNKLSELIFSDNQNLISLLCHNNRLTELDFTGLTGLQTLLCNDNRLTELDTKGTNLLHLVCSNNKLTHLQLPKTLLELDCRDNHLTDLDLTQISQINDVLIGKQTSLTDIEVPDGTTRILDMTTLIRPENIPYITTVTVTRKNSIYPTKLFPNPDGYYTLYKGAFPLSITLSIPIQSGTRYAEYIVTYQILCDHNWSEATCTSKASCTLCKASTGELADHKWLEASDLRPKYCAVCGKTEGHPLTHVWKAATCTTPKTCVYCDATEGSPNGHAWKEPAPCATSKSCSNCRATERILASTAHSFITRNCFEDVCSACGHLRDKETPQHTLTTQDCLFTYCGQCTYKERLSSTEHEYVKSSCFQQRCTRCGDTKSVEDHNWSKRSLTKRPYCLDCGQTHSLSQISAFLLLAMIIFYGIALVVAGWYLWDRKRERKY